MLEIKVHGTEMKTEAKGTNGDIIVEAALVVIGAGRAFSEVTNIPVEEAILMLCNVAMQNCDSKNYKGTVVNMKIPKKGDEEK